MHIDEVRGTRYVFIDARTVDAFETTSDDMFRRWVCPLTIRLDNIYWYGNSSRVVVCTRPFIRRFVVTRTLSYYVCFQRYAHILFILKVSILLGVTADRK